MADQQTVFSCEDKILAGVEALNLKFDKLLSLVSTMVPADVAAALEDYGPDADPDQMKLTVKAFSRHMQDLGYGKVSYLQIQSKLMEKGIIARRTGFKRTGEPQSGYELTAKGADLGWIEDGGNGSILLLVPQAEARIAVLIGADEE